jgi:hypothetical protein
VKSRKQRRFISRRKIPSRPFGFAYALHKRQTQEISRPEFVRATGSIYILEQRTDFVHHANGGGGPPNEETKLQPNS